MVDSEMSGSDKIAIELPFCVSRFTVETCVEDPRMSEQESGRHVPVNLACRKRSLSLGRKML